MNPGTLVSTLNISLPYNLSSNLRIVTNASSTSFSNFILSLRSFVISLFRAKDSVYCFTKSSWIIYEILS